MFDNFDEFFNKKNNNNEKLQKFIESLMNMRESLKNDDERILNQIIKVDSLRAKFSFKNLFNIKNILNLEIQ